MMKQAEICKAMIALGILIGQNIVVYLIAKPSMLINHAAFVKASNVTQIQYHLSDFKKSL